MKLVIYHLSPRNMKIMKLITVIKNNIVNLNSKKVIWIYKFAFKIKMTQKKMINQIYFKKLNYRNNTKIYKPVKKRSEKSNSTCTVIA